MIPGSGLFKRKTMSAWMSSGPPIRRVSFAIHLWRSFIRGMGVLLTATILRCLSDVWTSKAHPESAKSDITLEWWRFFREFCAPKNGENQKLGMGGEVSAEDASMDVFFMFFWSYLQYRILLVVDGRRVIVIYQVSATWFLYEFCTWLILTLGFEPAAYGTKYQELAQLGPDCPGVQSEKTREALDR